MEKLLTPQEVAEHLGMSVGALSQLRYTGKGPVFRNLSPRKIRYTEADVNSWIESRAQTSTASIAS